jgi:hypothetical protein
LKKNEKSKNIQIYYSSAIFYFSENPFQKLVETAHIEGKDYSYFNVSSLKDPRYRKYFNVSSLKDPGYRKYFNVSSLKDPRYRKYFNVSSLKDPGYRKYFNASSLKDPGYRKYFNVSSLKDPRYRKYFNVSSLKDPRYRKYWFFLGTVKIYINYTLADNLPIIFDYSFQVGAACGGSIGLQQTKHVILTINWIYRD